MTATEENQSEAAPYGYMLDPKTGLIRPKRRAGRTRTVPVADETDPAAHREALLTRQRQQQDSFYERNPGYKERYAAEWREANPDKYSEYNRRSLRKLKQEVMDAYGSHCTCCGETELAFLTIDHTDGMAPSIVGRWQQNPASSTARPAHAPTGGCARTVTRKAFRCSARTVTAVSTGMAEYAPTRKWQKPSCLMRRRASDHIERADANSS